ncbi:MAG: hypothetical protein MJZ12_05515 [Prevotella sp.]|nr:hypothetical protein [Prevotella sp.]
MKVKSLLFACTMLIAGLAQVFAVDAPKASPVNLEGGIQYLYNVGAKGFFVGANNWTTRASISTTKGWQTKFVLNADNLYTFQDLCESKNNAWKNVMCETVTAIYTDAASQPGQHTWNVEVAEDNTFKIVNTLWENTYLTWDVTDTGGDGNFTICNMVDPATLEEGSQANVWYAVSEVDYSAWLLAGKIEAAEAEYPGIDLAAIKAVASKADATLEELKQALTDLPNVIDAWKKAQINWDSASTSTPVDLTALLVNPSFDNQTYEGWAGTGYGKGGTTGPCAERYELVHDTYQKVSNVKPGVYAVKMDGFFRNGSTDNAFNTKGEKNYAYLYGTNGVDTCKTSIMGLFDGIVPEDPVEGVTFTYVSDGQTYYIPNSMKDACAFFDAGKYKDNTVYFGVTGDELTIGTFMKEKKTADWMLVDNFRLEYLGASEDAYQVWNDRAMADVRVYEEGVASTPVLEAYAAAVEAAEKADSYDAVIANIKAVEAEEKKVDANIAAWKALNDQVALCKSTVNGLNGKEADELKDYLDFDVEDMINNKEASTDELLAEVTKLKEMLDNAVANNLEPNTDVTDLIKNASFKSGLANWTNSKGAAAAGTAGGLKAFPCVEVYSGVVDVQQTITGLPKGVYKLSCQAFERPNTNGNYTGEEPSKVFLFMNSAETPVQNIMKDAIPEEQAVNYENSFFEGSIGEDYYNTGGTTNLDYLTPNASYIPNGMSGASYAFRAGRYYQEAAGLVTDGKMTLGLTSKGQTAHWVLWADFKLMFLGNEPSVVKPIVEEAIAALSTEKPYGTDVQKTVKDAVDAANEAIASGDGGKMVDALDALYAVKDPQAESIALFEKLNAKVEEMGDVINDSEADEAVKAEATAYWASVDATNLTNAEAEEAIANLGVYENKLAIPAGYKNATAENPVEMTGLIQNADVDAGAAVAWQYTKDCQNGPALAGGINGTPSIEFWNPDANGLKFNIWQEIAYLPAGTYMLKADVSNSLNGQEDNGEAGRAVLYLMQDSVFTYSDPVDFQEEGCVDAWKTPSVTMTLKEGKATVGVTNNGTMAARWFVADNFQLFYLGEEATGIIDINATGSTSVPVAIYGVNGARISTLSKGINIIKLGNGKVQKVLVK